MLKMAENSDLTRLCDFCGKFPLGARIACGALAYGLETQLFSAWYGETDGKISCAVSLFDGCSTIAAEDTADFDELGFFISSLGFSSLCADAETFERLGITPGFTKQLYEYAGGGFSDTRVKEECDLKEAYSLISRSIPNAFPGGNEAYLCWLSDYTYRRRRCLSRLSAVCGETGLLACAFTAAECPASAIISGVACDESARGTGLGRAVVLSLASKLQSENKRVYVIALGEGAGAFYEKIGFIKRCTASYLERKSDV